MHFLAVTFMNPTLRNILDILKRGCVGEGGRRCGVGRGCLNVWGGGRSNKFINSICCKSKLSVASTATCTTGVLGTMRPSTTSSTIDWRPKQGPCSGSLPSSRTSLPNTSSRSQIFPVLVLDCIATSTRRPTILSPTPAMEPSRLRSTACSSSPKSSPISGPTSKRSATCLPRCGPN